MHERLFVTPIWRQTIYVKLGVSLKPR